MQRRIGMPKADLYKTETNNFGMTLSVLYFGKRRLCTFISGTFN